MAYDRNNRANYILLPETADRPHLYVAKHRLGASPEVIESGQRFNLPVKETAKEKDGTGYIGDINWEHALTLNQIIKSKTPTLRIFQDFSRLLFNGLNGDIVYHGNGNKITDNGEIESIMDEILGIRNPSRSEYLDAHFVEKDGILHIEYAHRLVEGILKPQYLEILKSCMEDGHIFHTTYNSQGLPTYNSQGLPVQCGIISYLRPRKDSVAGFGANSDRGYLGCCWVPTYSYSSLGVREVRENFEEEQ